MGGFGLMAIMYPADIENYEHTFSEEKFYKALKEQLPDKYHVFYSIRWYESAEGQRINSECDFLVFDPSFGFLTIEVKGGKKIEVQNGTWLLTQSDNDGTESVRTLNRSPFEQAEISMRYFHDYFEKEFANTFNGVYGFAVCFPLYQVDEKLDDTAVSELVIDIRDFDNLAKKINEIFHYWKNRRNNQAPFSPEQRTRFISLINKRISLSAAAGALIPIKEKEFKLVNLIQDSIIDFLYNYNQVQVVGGAGTGKTFIAIKKAKRELLQEKKVLYVCKNKELAHFVSKQFEGEENFRSVELYQLLSELLGEKVDESKSSSLIDMLDKVSYDCYDAIIVDEGQDINEDEAFVIKMLLKDEKKSTLYIFLDENQNLFDVNFKDVFDVEERPYVLRYNIRNTGEIYDYAIKETNLGKDTIANSLLGVKPEIHECKNSSQAITNVANIVNKLVQKEYVKPESIVILSDKPYNQSAMKDETRIGNLKISWNVDEEAGKDDIKFRTVAEFKGLEADIIIYLTHTYKGQPNDEKVRKNNYVGYTRPRYYLYIVNTRIK